MSFLESIVVPILIIIDELLDYWVSGNQLTDPWGENLVSTLATIVQNVTLFWAEMSTLLAANTIG